MINRTRYIPTKGEYYDVYAYLRAFGIRRPIPYLHDLIADFSEIRWSIELVQFPGTREPLPAIHRDDLPKLIKLINPNQEKL